MAQRRPIVVKLGSSTVVDEEGRARADVVEGTALAVSAALDAGELVAIVSSGAIALGAARAGIERRRLSSMSRSQAASALGQAQLVQLWQDAFAAHERLAAQVLLTAFDITDRRSYLNIRDTLQALFTLGAVPVLNENDATSTDEIRFSDNDILAAQVAVLVNARALILLTGVEGVLRLPPGEGPPELISDGAEVAAAVLGEPTAVGRGGIGSKISAAQLASAGGVEAFIASPDALSSLLRGEARGTRFAPGERSDSAFKLWLRYGKRPVSRLTVDDGAATAVRERGASLLAVGVESWAGDFRRGDGVEVVDRAGTPLARGLAAVDSAAIQGRPTDLEVIHRDQLVVLTL
jgi:glutamate 5-kinase